MKKAETRERLGPWQGGKGVLCHPLRLVQTSAL